MKEARAVRAMMYEQAPLRAALPERGVVLGEEGEFSGHGLRALDDLTIGQAGFYMHI